MSQVSFWRKQISDWLQDPSLTRLQAQALNLLSRKRSRFPYHWFIASSGITLMLAWDWKLVIATGMGAGSMMLVFRMQGQGQNWRSYWAICKQFLSGTQGKLTLAVGSGGIVALGTYIAASVWADSENRWLAIGTIFQGVGTLLTLSLLIWQLTQQQEKKQENQFEKLLNDLTASDPLKRLIAIRQVTHLVKKARWQQSSQQQLIEYFCLMLSVEKEAIIREAILESLQLWQKNQVDLQRSPQTPLEIPVNLREHSVTYQE